MMSGFVQASRQMPHVSQPARTRCQSAQSSQILQQGQNFASTTPFDAVRSFSAAHHRQTGSSSTAGQSAAWNPQGSIATEEEEEEEEIYAWPAHWIIVPDSEDAFGGVNLSASFTSMQASTSVAQSAGSDEVSKRKQERESATALAAASNSCSTLPRSPPAGVSQQVGGESAPVQQEGYSKDLLEVSVNCEGIAQSPIQLPALAHILQAAQEMRNMQDDAELRNKGVSSIVTDLESVLQLPSPTSSSSACNSSRDLLIQSLDQCVTSSRSSSSKDQQPSASGPAATASEHRRRDSCGSNATSFNLASLLHTDIGLGSMSTAGLGVQEERPTSGSGRLDPPAGDHDPRGGLANALVEEFGSRVGEHTNSNGVPAEDKNHDLARRNLEQKVTGIRSLVRLQTASVSSEGLGQATYEDMHKFQSPRDLNFQSIFNDSPLPLLHHFDYPPSTAGFGSAAELHPPEVFSDAISCDYQAMSDGNTRQSLPFSQPWEDCDSQQPTATASVAYSSNPWQAADPVHGHGHLAVFDSDYSLHGQGQGQGIAGGRHQAASDPIRSMSSCKAEEVPPGVHLVNLVISCGDAIGSSNFAGANLILSELSTLVSPYGDAMQRVASYFTYGLVARMAGIGCGPGLYQALGCKEPTPEGVLHAFQCFHQFSPFTKFAGLAANQTLLEAFEGEVDVHVVDFSMTRAWQWIALLHDLKSRMGGMGGPPARIRLTSVIFSEIHCTLWSPEAAQDAGEQIAKVAQTLGLQFEFRLVVEVAGSLQPWQLVDPDDCASALAVSCTGVLHKLLHDDTGHAMGNVLAVVRNLKPKVVAVVEPDANNNCSHFLGRFLEALHFYSAIFDSLAAALDQESPERAQIEQLWFGREIINIVACEGRERVERYERLNQWRERLIKAGFQAHPISGQSSSQVQWLLNQYPGNGFQIASEHGCLTLRWKERPVFFASAWSC